ncbi:hypothetical protein RJ639_022429 [Escallonia herrerae]|uniref:Ribosomal protein L1 n=1 Tax=Escallonia herrerae TaxID=1293975 RepID=A0AA89AG77_9ASTE|nr:hypothetical protein RJ639_022429 [Escallonia herrerae]
MAALKLLLSQARRHCLTRTPSPNPSLLVIAQVNAKHEFETVEAHVVAIVQTADLLEKFCLLDRNRIMQSFPFLFKCRKLKVLRLYLIVVERLGLPYSLKGQLLMRPKLPELMLLVVRNSSRKYKKDGTVTNDLSRAVREAKGKVSFKKDQTAIVHIGLGKVTLPEEALRDNVGEFVKALLLAKPPGLKKSKWCAVHVSSYACHGLRWVDILRIRLKYEHCMSVL